MSGALAGKRVVNTRAIAQAEDLNVLLEERGAVPIAYPCIDISMPSDTKALYAAMTGLNRGDFDWLVLTSANAVRSLALRNTSIPAPPPFRTAVVGPATRDAAQRELGLSAGVMPAHYQASNLAAAIPVVTGQRVLIPQSAIAPSALADALSAKGAIVTTVTAYRTVVGTGGVCLAPLLVQGEIDAVAFASSSAVDGFVIRLADEGFGLDLMSGIPVACIGESTASTARAHGFSTPILPVDQTLCGLVDSLETALSTGSISKGMAS